MLTVLNPELIIAIAAGKEGNFLHKHMLDG
jgi:hypothetical protein